MINIGTLSAFVTVSLGILVLRKERPDLKPSFRVPFGKVIPILSAVLCVYLMLNLATGGVPYGGNIQPWRAPRNRNARTSF